MIKQYPKYKRLSLFKINPDNEVGLEDETKIEIGEMTGTTIGLIQKIEDGLILGIEDPDLEIEEVTIDPDLKINLLDIGPKTTDLDLRIGVGIDRIINLDLIDQIEVKVNPHIEDPIVTQGTIPETAIALIHLEIDLDPEIGPDHQLQVQITGLVIIVEKKATSLGSALLSTRV